MLSLVNDILKANLHSQSVYLRWLKRDLADCESILELGCGSDSPLLKIGLGKKTDAVDIWQPYVEMHNRLGNYNQCCQADILKMEIIAKYDAVVICDVLEHLAKDEVYSTELFTRIEGAAKKKVILFTPNGFIENDEVDGDPYQRHVSSWHPQDYINQGYKVVGATGLRWLYGKAGIVKRRPHTFMEYVGQLSQLLVYHFPRLAWHSYAVKEL